MRIKHYIGLVLFCSLALCASMQGQILVHNENLPDFPFYRYSSEGEQSELFKIKGSLFIEETKQPIIFYFTDATGSTLLLFPKDTVTLSYQEGRCTASFSRPYRNGEQVLFQEVQTAFLSKKYLQGLSQMITYSILRKYDSIIQSDYKDVRYRIGEYVRRHPIRDIYVSSVLKLVEVKYASERLGFTKFANKAFFQQGTISGYYNLFCNREDMLKTLAIPGSLACDTTQRFYVGYWSMLARQNNLDIYGARISSYEDYLKALYAGASHFCTPNRSVLQYHVLKAMKDALPAETYQYYEADFKEHSVTAALMRPSLLTVKEEGHVGDNLKDASGGSIRSFSEVLESCKGSVVYIDFWASWCKPCLEEMPYSKKLVEQFKGKGVTFLYLSVDEHYERWAESIQSNQWLLKERSYIFTHPDKATVLKTFHVSAFPRYMILNRSGEVVDADAPRPSNKKLVPLLNQLIKQ